MDNREAQSVYLKNKVYICSGSLEYGSRKEAVLYSYAPATDTWQTIATPVYDFALTTYHSRLVLVGGNNRDDGERSTKLWTLSEDGQWQETLPPMETACVDTSAVSHGDHLLVIDGDRKEVNVYNGHYWAKAKGLPEKLHGIKSTLFNSDLYVAGWREVYSASLDSLIASCQPSETSQPYSVWNKLPGIPEGYLCPVAFGGRLVSVQTSAIYAYNPSDRTWMIAGETPGYFSLVSCATVLPRNELIVICDGNMSKASLICKCIFFVQHHTRYHNNSL